MKAILFNPKNLAWIQSITFLNSKNRFEWTISMATLNLKKYFFFCASTPLVKENYYSSFFAIDLACTPQVAYLGT